MASSSFDIKCPCYLQKYYSKYELWFQHIKDCSLEKFNDKDADHNNQTSQQTKHTVSYECFMCKTPLSSILMVLEHTSECFPIYV